MKIICYMYQSIDGRIDCSMTEKIDPESKSYYEHLESFGSFTQINGKTTNAMHYAEKGVFKPENYKPCGKTFYKAKNVDGYQVCMDTQGTLLWNSGEAAGKPLLVITSEKASAEYLEYLKSKGISYIACGEEKINLKEAAGILEKNFGVALAVVTGGGHINGSLLDAGLIDEVEIMVGPGIDGREGWAASFDGRAQNRNPVLLDLLDVEKLEKGTVLLRYKVRK